MDERMSKLKNAPIVEAVLDIECDMPPTFQLAGLEPVARDAFRAEYPKFRPAFMLEHRIETKAESQPQMSSLQSLRALQFLHDDEKQLLQIGQNGFSFNKLAPYSTLDDYLPEMKRTWNLFAKIASPVQIRAIRLRYINRISLPLEGEGKSVELKDYLSNGPHLPDSVKLRFLGFFNQHAAVDVETGNHVNIILAAQPVENNMFPLILDITVESAKVSEPSSWGEILDQIESLRRLKNSIFYNTITEKCTNLFQ